MEVARSWHAGLVYPYWVQYANYGAGEPRLIFYPPASWLLGALLGSVVTMLGIPVYFLWKRWKNRAAAPAVAGG